MNIDKLTELLNKRVDYKEIIDKLKDFEEYYLAIHHRGPYSFTVKMLDKDCSNIVIDYYYKKIKDIELMIKGL